jgi:hypothetical protein
MSIIPCQQNEDLRRLIKDYAEVLKNEAHKLGNHGLQASEFYNSGLFRGAIERVRGQFAATMQAKREFVRNVLEYMKQRGVIVAWHSAGGANRHDYVVELADRRLAGIELKGCLDGNNTNIFDRPAQVHEFVIWSVCSNPGADPQLNAWSGIHTRLSAEIIERHQLIDGVVIWDMVCGTVGRPCPKIAGSAARATSVSHYTLPPPCVYVMPATIPTPRNNPNPKAQALQDVHFLNAVHECFGGHQNEVSYVDFEVEHRGAETVRRTVIRRGGQVVRQSDLTPIRRA